MKESVTEAYQADVNRALPVSPLILQRQCAVCIPFINKAAVYSQYTESI